MITALYFLKTKIVTGKRKTKIVKDIVCRDSGMNRDINCYDNHFEY